MEEFDPAPTEHEVTSVNFSPKTIQKYKKRIENGYDLPDEDYEMWKAHYHAVSILNYHHSGCINVKRKVNLLYFSKLLL